MNNASAHQAEGSRNGFAVLERMMQITEIDDPRLVKGLAHPLRIQILRVLENRVASPSEIADEIGAPLGNVSYHVRFLARVDLIELTSTKPRRGAVEHYYRAVGRVRVTDDAWSQVPDVVRRGMVGSTLEQTARMVSTAASSGGFDRRDAVVNRRELALDDRGFAELAAELDRLSERVRQIEDASAERLAAAGEPAENGEDRPPTGLVMMLFDAPSESESDTVASNGDGAGRRRDGNGDGAGRRRAAGRR